MHRDVKPGNLLVSDSDVVKLADFGIARAADQSSITQVGSVLGTAAYLSPEQARGDEAGPRADLYSLGVVTYQLISGRLPYEASSLSELALKQQRESPIPLDELDPEVPRGAGPGGGDSRWRSTSATGPPTRSSWPRCCATAPAASAPAARPRALPPAPPASCPAQPTGDATRAARADPPTAGVTGRARQVPARRQPPRPEAAACTRARQAAVERPAPRSERPRLPAADGGAGVLAVLALIVIAAVTISNSTSNTVVHYQKVVAHDAQSAINQLPNLINKYTK